MPGIGQSYNQSGSSIASRLATQWQQQTGRPADASDPEYAAWLREAMPAMLAQDQGDLQRSQARWRVADRIATVAALSVIGAGVGSAISGAGAASGSASAGPAFGPGAANTGIWSGAGMTPAAYGAAGTGAGVGSAAGSAAGGAVGRAAGTGAGGMFAGMSARDLAALGLGLGGTIGGALSPRPNMAPNTMTQDPNLQKLLNTMQGRLDKSEPLYDSIMSMANGLLPSQYQKGGGGMG